MSNIKPDYAEHVYFTYRTFRFLIVLTCFAIPIGLILVGIISDIWIQDSLSDYYYAEYPPKSLRVMFVGLLFLLGGLLIAYRGFDTKDNLIHTFAGIFALGVAIFPMNCPDIVHGELCYTLIYNNIHYISALLLFGFSIISIIYNGGEKLKKKYEELIEDEIRAFIFWRSVSAITVGGGIVYALMMLITGGKTSFIEIVWIPESMGFIGFGIYWWAVTHYIALANKRDKEKVELEKLEKRIAPEKEHVEWSLPAIP